MADDLEIIVATKDAPAKPRVRKFEELYPIRDDIDSLMFLWNENSYYVSPTNRLFIVNGGRRLIKDRFGTCRAICRKRNQLTLAASGGEEQERATFWLIGLEDVDTGEVFFVKVSENGRRWGWGDML